MTIEISKEIKQKVFELSNSSNKQQLIMEIGAELASEIEYRLQCESMVIESKKLTN